MHYLIGTLSNHDGNAKKNITLDTGTSPLFQFVQRSLYKNGIGRNALQAKVTYNSLQ